VRVKVRGEIRQRCDDRGRAAFGHRNADVDIVRRQVRPMDDPSHPADEDEIQPGFM
jgi:hypothetical protein